MSYEVNMARAELRAERAAAKREARGTSEKALPVECASCGWTGKRKTGNPVFCPKRSKCAAFQVSDIAPPAMSDRTTPPKD